MLKPSGGFLKKLFDPTRMAQRKKPADSITTGSAMKRPAPSVATRGGGNKGFFGRSKEA